MDRHLENLAPSGINAPVTTKAVRTQPPKQSFASCFFGYDIFLSFALGPPPRGTRNYASDLARRLRERNTTVFFSEDELPPGGELSDKLRKGLKESKILVVVANHGTLQDPRWVRTEVEEFRKYHPKRPIIPINISGALQGNTIAASAQEWLKHEGKKWIDEMEDAVASGIAGQHVVDGLETATTHIKANTRWILLVVATIMILISLVIYAKQNEENARQSEAKAISERDHAVALRVAAESRNMLSSYAPGSYRAILLALAAHDVSLTTEIDGALLNALSAQNELRKLILANDLVSAVAFSPDGKHIVSNSGGNTLQFWDVHTGMPIGSPLKGHTDRVYNVAFSLNGRLIASGSEDRTLRLWDAQSGKPVGQPLTGHEGGVRSVTFSPDSQKLVSGSFDSTLRLWDVQSGKQIGQPFKGHTGNVSSVAFSPDGRRIVSGGQDQTLRLWDVQNGKQIGQPFMGHTNNVQSVAFTFSPDGQRIVSGSSDTSLRLWDAQTGKQIGQPLMGHTDVVQSVASSPDGKTIVSAGWDKSIRLWDAQSGKQIGQPLMGHEYTVLSVAYSPDGKNLVSGSWDKTIRLWDALQTPFSRSINVNEKGGWFTVLSPDGKLIVSGNRDDTVWIWDAQTGQMIAQPIKVNGRNVTSVAFSPDSSRIVTAISEKEGDIVGSHWINKEASTLQRWDAQSGMKFGDPIKVDKYDVASVVFSPDGERIILASYDNTLRRLDVHTGKQIGQPLKGHEKTINSFAISPDGKRIVSASDDATIRIWDAQTGQPLVQPIKYEAVAKSVAFSPDSQRIVTGSIMDDSVQMWDVQTGKPIGPPFKGHEDIVESVAFSHDGNLVVSGSDDKTVRLWDVQTGQQIGPPLTGHDGEVRSVAFSPDGRFIVSGGRDKTIRLWPGSTTWTEYLCKKLTRNMSHKEWREQISKDIPYIQQCPGLPVSPDDSGNNQEQT